MSNHNHTIADRLKAARISKNLTQKALAEAVGTHQQTIDRIERGLMEMPNKELLTKMSRVLNVTPAWLAFGAEAINSLSRETLELAFKYEDLSAEDKAIVQHLVEKLKN